MKDRQHGSLFERMVDDMNETLSNSTCTANRLKGSGPNRGGATVSQPVVPLGLPF